MMFSKCVRFVDIFILQYLIRLCMGILHALSTYLLWHKKRCENVQHTFFIRDLIFSHAFTYTSKLNMHFMIHILDYEKLFRAQTWLFDIRITYGFIVHSGLFGVELRIICKNIFQTPCSHKVPLNTFPLTPNQLGRVIITECVQRLP